MKRIPQEHPRGCAIACAAMVSNRTYRDVVSFLDPALVEGGLSCLVLQELLHVLGVPHFLMYRFNQLTQKQRDPWPFFFAPTHIVCVGGHTVVYEKGTILDPDRIIPLPLESYGIPSWIVGIRPPY